MIVSEKIVGEVNASHLLFDNPKINYDTVQYMLIQTSCHKTDLA